MIEFVTLNDHYTCCGKFRTEGMSEVQFPATAVLILSSTRYLRLGQLSIDVFDLFKWFSLLNLDALVAALCSIFHILQMLFVVLPL